MDHLAFCMLSIAPRIVDLSLKKRFVKIKGKLIQLS